MELKGGAHLVSGVLRISTLWALRKYSWSAPMATAVGIQIHFHLLHFHSINCRGTDARACQDKIPPKSRGLRRAGALCSPSLSPSAMSISSYSAQRRVQPCFLSQPALLLRLWPPSSRMNLCFSGPSLLLLRWVQPVDKIYKPKATQLYYIKIPDV